MTTESVSLAFDARGIAIVTLARPEQRNAFDDHTIAELRSAFAAVRGRPGARAMVLRSVGEHFSAGADLAWMRRMASYSEEQNLDDARQLAAMLRELDSLPLPTVARVQGAAFGGAVGLAACCDLVVAADDAVFSLSEVRIGLIPATIAPYVRHAIGERALRRYALTGERFGSDRAEALGLVSLRAPLAELDEQIEGLLAKLLDNGPDALAACKELLRSLHGRRTDDALVEETCARIAARRVAPEGQEGLSAFLEKRRPAWQLRGDP